MQTFLPFASFFKSAEALDNKRLNKQLLEGRQILDAIVKKNAGIKAGWQNHPATKMWYGYESLLIDYLAAVCDVAQGRNIQTFNNWSAIFDLSQNFIEPAEIPDWLLDPVIFDRIATSHQANLYFKAPDIYPEFKVSADYFLVNRDSIVCCDRCNYYWPTHVE